MVRPAVKSENMAEQGNMQNMNQSFSMRYLQIQQKMQQESRNFNMISNIMKARHEAAKNAINNVR